VLLFRPDTPRPTVATVTFSGNKTIATAELQNRMAAVATGTLFTEERFAELLKNQIRPMFENYGLLRVTFPKITAKEAEDVRGIDVHVVVEEGEPYKLRSVVIDGAPDTEHLLEVAKFKKDETFRLIEIVDGLERLRAELRGEGYMKVATNSTRAYDDEAKAVDMRVEVTLGDQYTMGKLTIVGLDILSEPVVRKMWGLEGIRSGS
jgi:outer membrane protein assembly factor BamA